MLRLAASTAPRAEPLATVSIPAGPCGGDPPGSDPQRGARLLSIERPPFSHAYAYFACNFDSSAVAEFGPTK
jgi:hypothetical protein